MTGIGTGIGIPFARRMNAGVALSSYNLYGYGTDSHFAYQLYDDTSDPSDLPVILYVDQLTAAVANTDATHGSLAWCLQKSVPRIILFEVSGIIDYSNVSTPRTGGGSPTSISNYGPWGHSDVGYCWVVGQSAPSPGIELKGTTLLINGVSDVLIQGIHFTPGDFTTSYNVNGNKGVQVIGSDNVVIDHCTLRWGVDSNFGSDSASTNITISNSLIYEALYESVHHNEYTNYYPERHSTFAIALSQGTTHYRNLFARHYERPPNYGVGGQTTNYVTLNNYFFNAGYSPGGSLGWSGGGADQKINIAFKGNVTYGDPARGSYAEASISRHNTYCHQDSKLYLNDLKCKAKDDTPALTDWETMLNYAGHTAGNEATSPIDISGYPTLTAAQVYNTAFLNSIGPKYKDSHDERIISDAYGKNSPYTINSPSALPARVVDWGDSAGKVDAGFDWNATPQQFDINVNGAGAVTVTLTADCNTIDEVVSHINTRLAAAGAAGVECYKIYPENHYVGLRTTSTGATQSIIIANSTATGVNFVNGTYTGSNQIGDGYASKANNSHSISIPANPNEYADNGLSNAENYLLSKYGSGTNW